MKRLIAIALLSCAWAPLQISANVGRGHLYVCRSPLLAFDFWNALQEIQRKGVTVTPKISEQVCNNMKAGKDPQCLRVEADSFKVVSSGWGGALALSDGKIRVWFHNPDAGGWVHPEYYVVYVNAH
jgi:hypothetical protein